MSGGWGSATTTTPSDAASAMHQTEDAEMRDVAREDAALQQPESPLGSLPLHSATAQVPKRKIKITDI